MKTRSQTPPRVREVAVGVLFASIAAAILIGTLSVLAMIAPDSDAAQRVQTEGYVFPVPAKHSYGDGVGAGRRHQGQDIFAACGRRTIAVRAGRIQLIDRHYAAGNYVVLDGRNTRRDFVYMHLRRNIEVREGQRVGMGKKLGYVGRSGNASGCHLHFEMWSRPGYYEGGHFMRAVTKHLRAWDRYS